MVQDKGSFTPRFPAHFRPVVVAQHRTPRVNRRRRRQWVTVHQVVGCLGLSVSRSTRSEHGHRSDRGERSFNGGPLTEGLSTREGLVPGLGPLLNGPQDRIALPFDGDQMPVGIR